MMTAIDTYPSRQGAGPRLLERQDPVVYSGQPPESGLTQQQADSYRTNGFLILPDLFTEDEVDALHDELDRLAADESLHDREERISEPGSNQLRSIFAVHQFSQVYAELARDPRLLDIAEYLLGSQVYLHQARANLKPGYRGKQFYWHSDFETWHVEDGMPRMRAVSMSLSLTPNYDHNGPLMLVPGSHFHYVSCVGKTPDKHYQQSLRRQEYGVPDDASLANLIDNSGIVTVTGGPGTVVFFECNTMHGSNSNITPDPRSNLFFVYNSVENRLESPFGGPAPRPEFIATRQHVAPLQSIPRAPATSAY